MDIPAANPTSDQKPAQLLASLIELIRIQTGMDLTFDATPIGQELVPELHVPPHMVAHGSAVCKLAKTTPTGEIACVRCKFVAQKLARKKRRAWVGVCSAGVTEMVWPVWHKQHLIGTTHFRSVLAKDARKSSTVRALDRSRRTGIPISQMRRALDAMPVVSRDKLLKAARFLPNVERLIQLVLAAHHWMPSPFADGERGSVRIRRNTSLVNRAFKHVQANYHQPLSSDTVARSLGYGTRYFVRRFAGDAGIPFLRFLALYRMAVARHLLRNTNLSIGDVNERVGFQDSNYFTATFTRLNKISPTAFRDSIRAGV